MPRESNDGVQSVERALSLLSILADHPADCSLTEIARAADLPTTTAHRLLGTLVRSGYVTQDPDSARYGLGPLLILIGQRAERKNELIRVARPWLEAIADETGETVNLTTRVADSVMQLDHVESRNMLRVTYPEGERFPMHASASGKLFLSWLPSSERERILASTLQPYTDDTLVRRSALEEEIALIRTRGYALDDAEREMGVRCVAAPIPNERGEVVAAVSISGPTLRITVEGLHQLAGGLIRAASTISNEWTSATARSSANMRAHSEGGVRKNPLFGERTQ